MTTTSGLTSGADPERATPGASWTILTSSSVTAPIISEEAPARVTSALPANPMKPTWL